MFSFVLSAIQLRKNDVLALARVRASSQYLQVLDCVSYSCARKRSWLSLWLGLAVSISPFWIVYRTVRKKDFVALVLVRISKSVFSVWYCLPYSYARIMSWL